MRKDGFCKEYEKAFEKAQGGKMKRKTGKAFRIIFPTTKHLASFLFMWIFFMLYVFVADAYYKGELACYETVDVVILMCLLAFATIHFYIKWVER